jgi:hypothetical protein
MTDPVEEQAACGSHPPLATEHETFGAASSIGAPSI